MIEMIFFVNKYYVQQFNPYITLRLTLVLAVVHVIKLFQNTIFKGIILSWIEFFENYNQLNSQNPLIFYLYDNSFQVKSTKK